VLLRHETQTDLMKKGLRRNIRLLNLDIFFRNTDRPDEEGIKTLDARLVQCVHGNTDRPDEEGIKTVAILVDCAFF